MEVLWPGPLFSLSVGCFGKQDCQICTERERRGGICIHGVVEDSKGESEFTLQVCSSVHNVSRKTGGSFRTVAISNLLLLCGKKE